ncbi:hypothetical protein DIPPA_35389 [Diplonema papillatum]|nr:hypothetical protein DIPPA_35389 [Diplonema papillatum]
MATTRKKPPPRSLSTGIKPAAKTTLFGADAKLDCAGRVNRGSSSRGEQMKRAYLDGDLGVLHGHGGDVPGAKGCYYCWIGEYAKCRKIREQRHVTTPIAGAAERARSRSNSLSARHNRSRSRSHSRSRSSRSTTARSVGRSTTAASHHQPPPHVALPPPPSSAASVTGTVLSTPIPHIPHSVASLSCSPERDHYLKDMKSKLNTWCLSVHGTANVSAAAAFPSKPLDTCSVTQYSTIGLNPRHHNIAARVRSGSSGYSVLSGAPTAGPATPRRRCSVGPLSTAPSAASTASVASSQPRPAPLQQSRVNGNMPTATDKKVLRSLSTGRYQSVHDLPLPGLFSGTF